MIGDAGGMYIDAGSTVFMNGGAFTGNTAHEEYGGAIYGRAADILSVYDMVFESNSANIGGGMALLRVDSARLAECQFSNNEAITDGGGLYTGSSMFGIDIINCTFQNNFAGATNFTI